MPDLPQTFAALADPVRFAIVDRLLREGELSAGDLGKDFDISAPAVSQHLGILREAGILTRRARAQKRLYSVEPQGLSDLVDWANAARQFWESGMNRLERALKNQGPTQ
ncbi:metalloregulator ArsR/SmtB family transcription factor [Primorskyibacter aestuariivivens]|uniref:ArsR/SmtB family transcription factor n=1 Tax=Primorskyibacter aestuariivivens TaxID=1888912 RepID=UPI002300D98D|nr:metalloregulator ArsR/SmtB family transcription factor [Primorskyibacter aestuariivivens]MDA7429513.1 metalloregulator ArsR/SmtB family transcription factor [Primorskyibacter aestuariivivens]